MNDNLINYNIDQVDTDSIEDHKIEPVYNTDKNNTNITPISYQKEENKTSEEIIFNKNKIINNEEQKTDENNIVENKNIENKEEKNEETNKDNHEEINHEEKELYQQRDNFYPQINNNPKEEINNNEGYNGGYYQQYENYELIQKLERNVPNGENIIDPNSYPDEKQIKLHYSHLQIQENSPENDSINPPPNSIQLQSYEEIPNKFPYQIEPLPPQGAGGFPPIQYQIPPNGINGPKFLSTSCSTIWSSCCSTIWSASCSTIWSTSCSTIWSSCCSSIWSSCCSSVWSTCCSSIWSTCCFSIWSTYCSSIWSTYCASIWSSCCASIWSSCCASI